MRRLALILLGILALAACIKRAEVATSKAPDTHLIVVRHAQAYKNLESPPEGVELDSLTPLGQAQAASLARRIAKRAISRVFCSPKGRCIETAKIIAAAANCEVEVVEGLRPLKAGTIDGQPTPWSWREAQWAEGRDPRPEGGESLSDGLARANASFAWEPQSNVVVVTHGDIAAALIGGLLRESMSSSYAKLAPETGAAVELTSDGQSQVRRSAIFPAQTD